MSVETLIEDPRWDSLGLGRLAERAAEALLAHLSLGEVEITLMGCDDARIAELNTEFRGKPSATNVLSWPAEDLTPPDLPEADPDGTTPLGDIAIAYDTCAREADEQGKPFEAHVTHLVVHGMLHLLGYDHENDEDATLMEGLEVEILGKLGVNDPYRET